MKYFVVLLFLTLILSCTENENLHDELNDTKIEIYLVEENDQGFFNSETELNSLKTDEMPWLKHAEILFYDWSSHMFFLKNEKEKGKYATRNFIVKANGESLFAGVFFPAYMSSIPQIPAIWAHDNLFVPEDVVAFGQFGYSFTGDIEGQLDFKQALIASGLFRAGINVELVKVKRLNSKKLEYTFKVKNIDVVNIYVLDPQKMGAARFHYFTNGVSVQVEQTSYFPNLESTPTQNIELDWYKKLHPGESITRTIELEGYHNLPSGKVSCRFVFPGSQVEKGEWNRPDGRIWLGNYLTEKEFIFRKN